MPSTLPIIVRHERERPRDWQRFVAALCFMEFYVTFVYAGTLLWSDGRRIIFYPWLSNAASWTCVAMMGGALLLFVAGRGLWRGRGREERWLWLGLVSVSVLLGLEVLSIGVWFSQAGTFAPTPTDAARYLASSAYIAPLGALIICTQLARSSSRLHGTGTATWVYCAAVFCLGSVPGWIFRGHATMTSVGEAGWRTTGNYAYVLVAHLANGALPLVTCVALLLRRRTARTAALIVATVVGVSQWYDWYPPPKYVNLAIGALRLGHGFPDIGSRVWTNHDFVCLFVEPVRVIGPWLLIAIYAWRVPMRQPPEDGSPFPRHFCGHCHYNLHGAVSTICPECGSEFSTCAKVGGCPVSRV